MAWATVRGKSVEQAAVDAIGLREPLGDDADHDIIGHEFADLEIAGRLTAQFGARLVRFAEHVAGREMDDPEMVPEPLGLRPFSSTRRPDKHNAHDSRVESRGSESREPELVWLLDS